MARGELTPEEYNKLRKQEQDLTGDLQTWIAQLNINYEMCHAVFGSKRPLSKVISSLEPYGKLSEKLRERGRQDMLKLDKSERIKSLKQGFQDLWTDLNETLKLMQSEVNSLAESLES